MEIKTPVLMSMSLIPKQQPDQRMRTVSIEEIIALAEKPDGRKPQLEYYFSPSKKDQFTRDYIHYLNSMLLESKHGRMDTDLYLLFVISFQFIAPLLEIPSERELVQFYRILENNYKVGDLDINLHFVLEDYEEFMAGDSKENDLKIEEDAALEAFRNELDASYTGRREVKESVQKRLKNDAIQSIMRWQQMKALPELAEAFGRSIVIPSFFSYTDKKLREFYRRSSQGIRYEVDVPEF